MGDQEPDGGNVAGAAVAPMSALPVVQAPSYDGNSDFDKFIRRFERVALANSWNEIKKFQVLPALLQGEAENALDTLPDAANDYEQLKAHLKSIFRPEQAQRLYLTQFNQRTLKREESPFTYASDLKKLFQAANPEITDANVIDRFCVQRFIEGLKPELRTKFYEADIHTLEAAIKKLNSVLITKDVVSKQEKSVEWRQQPTARRQFNKSAGSVHQERPPQPSPVCKYCKKPGHAPEACMKCFKCGLRGHVARKCFTMCNICKQRGHIARNCNAAKSSGTAKAETTPATLSRRINGEDESLGVKLTIGQSEVLAILDGGSTRSLISLKVVQQAGIS